MAQDQPGKQGQSDQFCEIMKALTHEWGFVVVVTAATAATTTQWTTALQKIRVCMLAHQDSQAQFDPSTLALPVMHLEDADYDAARAAFGQWIRDYDDGEEEWESDVRRDVFVVVDGPALESLLAGDQEAAWVVAVDARHPSKAGRPDYPGWMRCQGPALAELFEELDAMDEGMSALCPARQNSGQIIVYHGSRRVRLVESEGGVEGTVVEFPRGTQRGVARGTQRGVTGGTQRGL